MSINKSYYLSHWVWGVLLHSNSQLLQPIHTSPALSVLLLWHLWSEQTTRSTSPQLCKCKTSARSTHFSYPSYSSLWTHLGHHHFQAAFLELPFSKPLSPSVECLSSYIRLMILIYACHSTYSNPNYLFTQLSVLAALWIPWWQHVWRCLQIKCIWLHIHSLHNQFEPLRSRDQKLVEENEKIFLVILPYISSRI